MCIAIRIYLYVIIYDTLEPKLNHDQETLITKPLAQNPWLETRSKMMQSIEAVRDAYLDLGSTSRVWIKVDATLGTRLAYALQTFFITETSSYIGTLSRSCELDFLSIGHNF